MDLLHRKTSDNQSKKSKDGHREKEKYLPAQGALGAYPIQNSLNNGSDCSTT